jgi:opacity protein-like surface antigen
MHLDGENQEGGTSLVKRAMEMMEYLDSQIARGKRMGVDFSEVEELLMGARMMLDEKTGIDLDFIFNFASDTKNGESEGLALALTASYFQYFKKERLSPYYKAGVNLSIFTDDKDIDTNDVEEAEVAAALNELGFESDSHGDDDITLSAGLGTEYFVTPEFSLFAEALLKISFSPFTVETVSPQAGLSFYF